MPFTCAIVVPGSDSAEQAAVRFLAQEGALMERGDAIFLVTRDGQTHIYEIAMPCTLSEKLIEDGSAVRPEQPVAFAAVDDENIPYGQPFVVERQEELEPSERFSRIPHPALVESRLEWLIPRTSTGRVANGTPTFYGSLKKARI